MNCTTCLKANSIPNCYTGTVLITIGYLDAAYFSTAVTVKITNIATGKETFQDFTTDGAGVVKMTAFDFMEIYQIEVLDNFVPLTIYSTETNDSSVTSGCCVDFRTIDTNSSSDFTLSYKTCTT